MLLLHPPVAKPGEPPAGIACLAGALRGHDQAYGAADLNMAGLLHLLQSTEKPEKGERWGHRAWKNRSRNLQALRTPATYGSFSRYQKAVREVNRLLGQAGDHQVTVSLANYQNDGRSPTSSNDLLLLAEQPRHTPFFSFYRQCLPPLLERHGPRHVGISINYLSQALNSFALIGLLRILAPGVKIVVGGGLITSWMRNARWSEPFSGLIDHCIAGCGQAPLLELLGVSAVDKSVAEYRDLPCEDYLAPGFVLPYHSSSGCFWNRCSFCPERVEGSVFRGKSPATVRQELALLRARYRPVLVHFLDNAIPPPVLASFSPDHPGLPWYGFARISKQLADLDFCRRLRASGCVMLKLGLESGSQEVLDRLDKGIDLVTVAAALHNLRLVGIATYVYLLFGTPAETECEARRTLEFIVKHHDAITFLNLAIFNMPLGSSETASVETIAFSGDDLALYTGFRHPQGWDRRKVRRFLDQEFKRQPQIGAIISRDPPQFTSNHAPFVADGFASATGRDSV